MAVSAMNRALSITLIFFASTTWRTNGSVLGLPIRTFGAGLAAEVLDFVVISGPLAAFECDRRSRPELRWFRERERCHVPPCRRHRDWRRYVDTGLGLVPVRIGCIRAVSGALLQDFCGDGLAEFDPLSLRLAVRNRGEIGRRHALHLSLHLRNEARQDDACRGCRGGLL